MKKLTMQEYKEIGEKFKQLNELVVDLIVKVGKGGKTKQSCQRLSKVKKEIICLRSDMEEEMYKEYPSEATTNVFYGEKNQ